MGQTITDKGALLIEVTGSLDNAFSDVVCRISGQLAVETGVWRYVVPRDGELKAVFVSVDETGSTGSTIVDVNLNGASIFDTEPEIAHDDADGVVYTSVAVSVDEGDVVTIDIDQVATGASGLSVLLSAGGTLSGEVGNMTKSVYDPDDDGQVEAADEADAVPWTGVTGKPSEYPPEDHNHVEEDITDLDHDAVKIQGNDVDVPVEADDGKVLAYNHSESKFELIADEASTGHIFLSAAGGWPSSTNGCAEPVKNEYATNGLNLYSLDFDPESVEYAEWTIVMPDDWDKGEFVGAKFYWTCSGGSAGDGVEWGIQARMLEDGDAIDQAWGSQNTEDDAWIADGELHISIDVGTFIAGGGTINYDGALMQFRIARNATAGYDDLPVDAKLLGVMVFYSRV